MSFATSAPRRPSSPSVRNAPVRSRAAAAYAAGQLLPAGAPVDARGLDRFDLAEGMFPPAPSVRRALARVPWRTLAAHPDREATELRRALARYLDVTSENVLVFSGADDVIDLIPRTYLDPGDAAVVVVPTFGRLVRTSAKVGARTVLYRLQERRGFALDDREATRLIARVQRAGAKLLWLCSPNNPTGLVVPLGVIDRIARACPGTMVAVDEAYQEFHSLDPRDSAAALVGQAPNIIVLRTFSKAFGLAGARVGYAVASEGACADLGVLRVAFGASAVSQRLALAALGDLEHVRRIVRHVRSQRRSVEGTLRANANLAFVAGSTTNLLLVKHRSADVASALLAQRILALDLGGSPGLERGAYVRISVGTAAANQRLRAALRDI